jgi:hypothetical protein
VGDLIAEAERKEVRGKGKGKKRMDRTMEKGTGKPAFPQAKGEEQGKESDAQFFSRRPKKEAIAADDFMATARERRITRRQLAGMMKRAANIRKEAEDRSPAAVEAFETLTKEAFGSVDTGSHSNNGVPEGGMAETLNLRLYIISS